MCNKIGRGVWKRRLKRIWCSLLVVGAKRAKVATPFGSAISSWNTVKLLFTVMLFVGDDEIPHPFRVFLLFTFLHCNNTHQSLHCFFFLQTSIITCITYIRGWNFSSLFFSSFYILLKLNFAKNKQINK